MKDEHRCGMHCSCWFVIGVLVWFAALASLVCGWITAGGNPLFGLDANNWYVNALILGVLAIPLKLKRHSMDCGCGMCVEPRSRK